MMHVILDTSIYSGNPRRTSAPFRALIRLAKADEAKLHIPQITKREFVGQQRESIEAPLKEAVAALKKLRRLNDSDEFGTFANDTIAAAKEMSEKAKAASEEEFVAWMKDIKAAEVAMSFEDAQGAFDAYFKGLSPFKSIKNREDIPDAFIWEAVKRLASEHKQIHFVVADNTLRGAASGHEGITTYAKLDEFIQTKECQEALKRISADENLERNRARVADRLPRVEAGLIKALESDIVSAMDGKEVRDPSIPDDNNEGMVTSVGDVSNVQFDFNHIEYYGDDDIGISFTATVECTLNYAVYKADYYLLDEGKMEQMSIDERNRHYYDVDEEYSLSVKGVLSLTIDSESLEEKLDDSELDDVILQAESDVEVDEIEVE